MRYILLFFLLPYFSSAQKWIAIDDNVAPIDRKEAVLLQPSVHLSSDTTALKEYIQGLLPSLQTSNSTLVLENLVESPKGKHFLFRQCINDRQVFRGSVKVNVALDGKILSVFDHTFKVDDTPSSTFPNHQPYHDGLMVHYEAPNNGKLHHYKLEEVYFEENGTLIPSIRLEVVEETDRYYEMVLNSDVKVMYQNDLIEYAAAQDSIVSLWVFNPDPLTTANQSYGAPYADANDIDVLELNAQRVQVQAMATFDNNTFSLENDFVRIRDFSFPDVAPVTSTTPEFNYTRSESGFEDVNAFYHITYFQSYIQSLGFNNLVNYQIDVDPHALNGADNSNFNGGFSPPQLRFGEGGVDDAEDMDVIIHEYGHAITHSGSPNTNTGTERKALDEAIGDYFASSYSRFLSPNRWSDVFTWDGHNEYWPGRSSVSTDHYPEDLNNNLYTDADIWSATLMQIWGDIGREVTDALMLQTTYSLAEGMTMPQAALLFIQADSLLFGGAHFEPIRQRMFDRGLIPWNVGLEEVNTTEWFRVFNTAGFTAGTAPARVLVSRSATAKLYNAVGQLVSTLTAANGTIIVSPEGLQSGIYMLEVTDKNRVGSIKLVKH